MTKNTAAIMSCCLTLASALILPRADAQEESGNNPEPGIVVVPPENIYVPPQVTEMDIAKVLVTGNLPDTCYKPGVVTAEINADDKRITIRNEAYFYKGAWCLFVLVPYTQSVTLGKLPAGTYQIHFDGLASTQPVGVLEVGRSTSGGN